MVGVGSVDERSVRLWFRCPEHQGGFRIRFQTEDGQERTVAVEQHGTAGTDWAMSLCYPDDVDGAEDLAPGTRYRFEVETTDGDPVDRGRFRTAPGPDSADEPFRFAFMSCHQPFDEEGNVHPEADRMLSILEPTLDRFDVSYVVLTGDQMYSDHPPGRSLFEEEHFRSVARHREESILDCEEDEILDHYHRRYRAIWALEEFRDLQRHRATYWILDDHEIVDNWGAAEEHSEPRWQRLGRAARRAFLHYQASHAMPADGDPSGSFHQSFRWGRTATFVTDMRSARAEGGPRDEIFGEEQLEDLEEFFAREKDAEILFVVLTVPIVPLPKTLVRAAEGLSDDGSDVDDRWESSLRVKDRDRFLRLVLEHQQRRPEQKLVLLSGDVHLGCAMELEWAKEDVPPFRLFVSSGVTNVLGLTDSLLVKGIAALVPKMELDGPQLKADFLDPTGDEQENPFSGLNFGIVEVRPGGAGGEANVRFRILTSPDEEEGDEAVVAFDSGEL